MKMENGFNKLDLTGKLIIKATLGSDTRLLPIHNDDLTYDELVLMMNRVFKDCLGQAEAELLLKYKDEDGDLVTIQDNSDLAFAIQYCKILRLQITASKGAGSQADNVDMGKLNQIVNELREVRSKVDGILDRIMDTDIGKTGYVVEAPVNDLEENGVPADQAAAVTESKEFDPLNQAQEAQEVAGSEQLHLSTDSGVTPALPPGSQPIMSPGPAAYQQQPSAAPAAGLQPGIGEQQQAAFSYPGATAGMPPPAQQPPSRYPGAFPAYRPSGPPSSAPSVPAPAPSGPPASPFPGAPSSAPYQPAQSSGPPSSAPYQPTGPPTGPPAGPPTSSYQPPPATPASYQPGAPAPPQALPQQPGPYQAAPTGPPSSAVYQTGPPGSSLGYKAGPPTSMYQPQAPAQGQVQQPAAPYMGGPPAGPPAAYPNSFPAQGGAANNPSYNPFSRGPPTTGYTHPPSHPSYPPQ